MTVEHHKTINGSLFFDHEKCIHSRNCVLNRPDVFVPNVEGEWIHPENASVEELEALADSCPSGAIRFESENKATSKPLINTLHVRENGPYAIKADLILNNEAVCTRLTLCRCGASKNKPYCDGSHSNISFFATGEPKLVESQALAKRNGVLEVTPIKDGPLMLKGNIEICAGTGKTVNRVEKTTLCRCGASKNKPYCDGSHKSIEFRSE